MIFRELDRPALLEGPEIGDLGLEHRAGPTVAVADGNFDAGTLFLDDQRAGIEAQEVKILGDQAEALKRRSLAVGDAA